MATMEEKQPGQENSLIPYLGKEMVMEILSRLSVKYLLRSRCVCRSWLALISDPKFVKKHLEHALQKDRSQRLLFCSLDLLFLERERNQEVDHDDDMVALPLDLPFNYGALHVNSERFLGSCNGLVCINANDLNIYLYNPSTKESRRLPHPFLEVSQTSATAFWFFYGLEVHGFGYDSSTDDYKLVTIVCSMPVRVYSLRNKSWKITEDFPYSYVLKEPGTLLNGHLHWVVCGEVSGKHCRLVAAFDLAREQFQNILAPDSFSIGTEFVIGVVRERLCLFYSNIEVHEDFWLMNVYGDSMSWTRFTISLSYVHLRTLCSWKETDKILVEADGRVILYNNRDHTYRQVRVDGLPSNFKFRVRTYVETLVSPNLY